MELLIDEQGRRQAIVDPRGLYPLGTEGSTLVVTAGTSLVDGHAVSWVWGRLDATRPSPRVRFERIGGLQARAAPVRRLSATIWVAQLPGSWRHVRVQQ